MLREILALFCQAQTPLCAGDVSRALEVDRDAVEGMLDLLVRTGRLAPVTVAEGCCTCPVRGGCVTMQLGGGKLYRLARAPATTQCGAQPSTVIPLALT